jgi:hypothetical protein
MECAYRASQHVCERALHHFAIGRAPLQRNVIATLKPRDMRKDDRVGATNHASHLVEEKCELRLRAAQRGEKGIPSDGTGIEFGRRVRRMLVLLLAAVGRPPETWKSAQLFRSPALLLRRQDGRWRQRAWLADGIIASRDDRGGDQIQALLGHCRPVQPQQVQKTLVAAAASDRNVKFETRVAAARCRAALVVLHQRARTAYTAGQRSDPYIDPDNVCREPEFAHNLAAPRATPLEQLVHDQQLRAHRKRQQRKARAKVGNVLYSASGGLHTTIGALVDGHMGRCQRWAGERGSNTRVAAVAANQRGALRPAVDVHVQRRAVPMRVIYCVAIEQHGEL